MRLVKIAKLNSTKRLYAVVSPGIFHEQHVVPRTRLFKHLKNTADYYEHYLGKKPIRFQVELREYSNRDIAEMKKMQNEEG